MNKLLVFLALVAGCSSPNVPPAAPDAGDAGAEPVEETPTICARDCKHLRALGCKAAHDTAEGGRCEEVCALQRDAGVPRNWRCRSTAKTCVEVDGCR